MNPSGMDFQIRVEGQEQFKSDLAAMKANLHRFSGAYAETMRAVEHATGEATREIQQLSPELKHLAGIGSR